MVKCRTSPLRYPYFSTSQVKLANTIEIFQICCSQLSVKKHTLNKTTANGFFHPSGSVVLHQKQHGEPSHRYTHTHTVTQTAVRSRKHKHKGCLLAPISARNGGERRRRTCGSNKSSTLVGLSLSLRAAPIILRRNLQQVAAVAGAAAAGSAAAEEPTGGKKTATISTVILSKNCSFPCTVSLALYPLIQPGIPREPNALEDRVPGGSHRAV